MIDYEIARTLGYQPQVFGYIADDVLDYADNGVGLRQKQVIFQHDNSATGYSFDNVSVEWATGVALTVGLDGNRTAVFSTDGDFVNIPVTSITGNGRGLSVDFTVFNGAIVTISVHSRGYGYVDTDTLEISSATLTTIGAHDGGGGEQGILLGDVYTTPRSGQIVLIAPTASLVTLTSGNESAVYFNYKNFGYYNVGRSTT